MNKRVQEILDMINEYVDNLKFKNEEGFIKTEDITRLEKIANDIKDFDLSIRPIKSGMKEQVYNQIQNLFESYMDKFVESLSEKEIKKEVDTDKFYASKFYDDFKKESLEILVDALKNNEITDDEYNEIIEEFSIRASNNDLNEVLSKITKPKPTSAPPAGQKWAWDAESQEWILVNE